MITPQLIAALCPRLTPARCAEIASGLGAAAAPAGINTPARAAAFVAQLAHESCAFRYCKEIWGPTDVQRRYEGRADLGNTQKGDGYRYWGRGWIQLTGRHNYRKFGVILGLDLEGNPDLAARADVAARLAAAYWAERGLNALADQGNFREITHRINGGYNGLADRERYYALALAHFKAQPAAQPRVLLVPQGGGEHAAWDGKPTKYGGVLLDAALVSQLRTVYPCPSGPWTYQTLRGWHQSDGDLVLERA